MKLLDLHLLAYGPFTDRHLDLSAGSEGLHVVYGLNEAGKSSALRALRALLYGVPERTQDDFRHSKADLRVGGLLRGADGTELHCYRRKGRKNTLLDSAGDPVAEDRLARLLGGVDERVFERLFGIDHAALVSGGQALLMERGREAEALFGSGLGSTAVHGVLESLEQEAQALFAPRGSKPLINAELGRLVDVARQQREVSLSARQWDEARKARNFAVRQLNDVDAQLVAAEKRRNALERIRRTLPGLAKRAQIVVQLASLGDVPVLEDGFGSRREAALSKRRLAAEGRSKAAARLAGLRQDAALLDVSEELLTEAEAIDELRERLGGYRKAARDRPGLVTRWATLVEQARQRFAEIRPDLSLEDLEQLRPVLARRRRATELGGRREALESTVGKAHERREENGGKLAAKRGELGRLPRPVSYEGLQQAVEAARRTGDVDSLVDAASAELVRHEEACARELSALGLWSGSLAALLSAPLPGEETLRRFAEDFQRLEEERRRLEETTSDVQSDRQRTDEALRALHLAGAVPTEAELQQARESRDQGWRLLRRRWIDGDDVAAEAASYAEGRPLPDAFEERILVADEIADRLRRESQRVHEQAAGQAKLEGCEQRAAEADLALKGIADRRQVLERSWQDAWAACGISPLPPDEMSAWMQRASRLRERAEHGGELRAKADDLRRSRDAQIRHLSSALGACGEPQPEMLASTELRVLLDHAESRLRVFETTDRRRATLEEAVADLEDSLKRLDREVESAEKALGSWASDWAPLMAELGLGEKATPGEVSDYLQAISDSLKLADAAKELQLRVDGIDEEARGFDQDVKTNVARLAPDLSGQPVGESVLQLHVRLGKHREVRSRFEELTKQARRAEDEVRETQSAIDAADAVLTELCRQACCESPDELQAIEARYVEHLHLTRQLRDTESELLEGGDGLAIEALETEAAAVDRDVVMAELTALKQQIEDELRPEREVRLANKINAERDFDAMAGSDEASALAEVAQQTLAGLRGHAERYVRLRVAARVLRDEIERFRRKHRDPILTRAGDYFRKLTCDSLASIETDFDESDQPVLVGVRPTGERLRVEAMSTGTRDQLYLALRLATLDHYVEGAEPLPFIVDDILIQFDDERARSTLSALVDHCTRNQVILFTHHGRVAEEARELSQASGQVFVHTLE